MIGLGYLLYLVLPQTLTVSVVFETVMLGYLMGHLSAASVICSKCA